MKIKLLLTGLMFALLLFGTSNVIGAGDHHHDEDTEACEVPNEFLTVTGYTSPDGHFFDKEEYHVNKGVCLGITFENQSPLEHDMNIDEVQGDNGIEAVHIHLMSDQAGPKMDGKDSFNVTIPDFDTEFDIFCTVPGHQDAGMQAKLIVGAGAPDEENKLPGFGFIFSISSILLLLSIRKMSKRSKIID